MRTSPCGAPPFSWCSLSAVVLAVALVVGACAGSATPTTSSVASATASTAQPELPGTEEFAMTEAQLSLAVSDGQTRIATCMSEAGFDYLAADYATVKQAMAAVGAAPGLSDADYVAQFGYGVSTRPDNAARNLGLGSRNLAIIEAFDATDRFAYTFTLLAGDPPEVLTGSRAEAPVQLQGLERERELVLADDDCDAGVLGPVITKVEVGVFGESQG